MAQITHALLTNGVTTAVTVNGYDHAIVSVTFDAVTSMDSDCVYATKRNIDISATLATVETIGVTAMDDIMFIDKKRTTVLVPNVENGTVYLMLKTDATDSEAVVEVIGTNALNANFNKAARGGESGGNYVGTTAPTNTDLLWRDTSVSPAVLKQYNGSAWVEVGGSPLQCIIINQSIVWTTSTYSTVIDMSAHKEKYRYYIIELPINSTLTPYIGLNYGETGTTTQIYKLSTAVGQTVVETTTNTSDATASAKIGTGYIVCSTYKAYAKIDCVGVIGFSEINGEINSSPDPLNTAYTSANGINNIHIYNNAPKASTFTLKIYGVK